MWSNRIKIISSIFIALCLILCFSAVPVNADSNQSNAGAFPPQRSGPPIGFNPVTASDSALKEYGFPARPSDSTALQEWDIVMQHAQNFVSPVQYQSTTYLGLTQINYYSTLAGYAVLSRDNPGNPTFNGVYGQWTQTSSPNCVSYWVGLGGAQSDGIIVQSGAASCLPQHIVNTYHLSSNYAFWVEDYPLDPIYEATPVVHAGDLLYVNVQYNGLTSEAFLLDESSNQYTWVNFNTPDYTGVSADYMFEPTTSPPPSIGSSQFSECWLDNSSSGFGLFTNYIYEQYDINSEAYPGPASNASFTLYCPG
jgi:hypothetical protein